MSMLTALSRHARLVLVVGVERVHLVACTGSARAPGATVVASRQLAEGPTGATWPALADALRELRRDANPSSREVDVALLRPLAHAKVLMLPPVRGPMLRELLTRAARRFFPVNGAAVVDATPLPGVAGDDRSRVLAVCALESTVDAVVGAVAGAGLRVRRLVPAPLAAAFAALAAPDAFPDGQSCVNGGGRWAVLLRDDAWHELLVLERAMPAAFEPLAADAPAPARDHPVHVLDDEQRASSGPALRSPVLLAACGVAHLPAHSPRLATTHMRAARATHHQHRDLACLAAGMILLVLAAWLRLDAARRELATVVAERRTIAAEVHAAHASRRSLDDRGDLLAAVRRIRGAAVPWTDVVGALTDAMPADAHVTALSADSAGVRISGEATSAAGVLTELQGAMEFSDVTLAAPVRRAEGAAGERFDITMRLTRRR